MAPDGSTRRAFLERSTLAGGALALGGVAVPTLPRERRKSASRTPSRSSFESTALPIRSR
jgi:hypothetical protein